MTQDPLALLAEWLPGVPGTDGYFPQMSLATMDLDGSPDVRTVLLSEIRSDGLALHADSSSRKVAQLSVNPAAALMLTIPEQARQIVLRGTAVQLSGPELVAAYRSRSRYLQLLAWLNTPEMARLPEADRHRRWAEFADAHPDGALDPPAEWTGFVVTPQRITFWQGDPDGPSRRTEYSRTALDWSVVILPG